MPIELKLSVKLQPPAKPVESSTDVVHRQGRPWRCLKSELHFRGSRSFSAGNKAKTCQPLNFQ